MLGPDGLRHCFTKVELSRLASTEVADHEEGQRVRLGSVGSNATARYPAVDFNPINVMLIGFKPVETVPAAVRNGGYLFVVQKDTRGADGGEESPKDSKVPHPTTKEESSILVT